MKQRQQDIPENQKHRFILFVSGMSVKSARALDNLVHICDLYLPDQYELQIIDITREKDAARDYQIVGIPTLIKTFPDPRRTILGDLSDTDKVLKILDIKK